MHDARYWEEELDRRRMRANIHGSDLDPWQQAFCESAADDIRVLAPAGSGKTLTFLWRCLHVHRRSESPQRFLIVTFTVAARAELETLPMNLFTTKNDRRIEHSALKTVAAFLNTEGGALVIGVEDGGKALGLDQDGFATEDRMQQHFVNMVRDRLCGGVAMTSVYPYFADFEGRRVLVVMCEPSREPVWVRDGKTERFFVRVGVTTQELQPSDVYPYVSARVAG